MQGKIKKYNCGDVILVHKSIEFQKEDREYKPRAERNKKTSAAQQVVNQQHASEKLFALIQTNFKGGDLHIIPTYSPENYPDSIEDIKRQQRNFIRRLEYAYKKKGYELKYIQVTEYEKSRIHHHYILNSVPGITVSDIQSIWRNGLVRCTPLEDNGYYKELSDYLIKETSRTFNTDSRVYGKRWTSSRNLQKPEVTTETIKIKNEMEFLTVPQNDKGYELIKGSEYRGLNEVTGKEFVTYAMRKIETIGGGQCRSSAGSDERACT